MSEKNQAELIALLMQLDPEDQADMMAFGLARLEQRKTGAKPITAAEWERLTFWQRKAFYWRARWFVFLDTHRKRKSA